MLKPERRRTISSPTDERRLTEVTGGMMDKKYVALVGMTLACFIGCAGKTTDGAEKGAEQPSIAPGSGSGSGTGVLCQYADGGPRQKYGGSAIELGEVGSAQFAADGCTGSLAAVAAL